MNDKDWIFPTVQEMANKTLRIENVELQSVFMTMAFLDGKPVGNIKRIQIDLNVDVNGGLEPTAKVTLYDSVQSKLQRRVVTEDVATTNLELLFDVKVTEIAMSWPAEEKNA